MILSHNLYHNNDKRLSRAVETGTAGGVGEVIKFTDTTTDS